MSETEANRITNITLGGLEGSPTGAAGVVTQDMSAKESRRRELAARVRAGADASVEVRELVALRKELDEAPKQFAIELERRQKELNADLGKARARANDAAAAQEELVREFIPAELRARRGRLEGARNDAIAACKGTADDVRTLSIQLHELRQVGADALTIKRAEGALGAKEVDLRALRRKADEAQDELDRAEAEFQAALAAALA